MNMNMNIFSNTTVNSQTYDSSFITSAIITHAFTHYNIASSDCLDTNCASILRKNIIFLILT